MQTFRRTRGDDGGVEAIDGGWRTVRANFREAVAGAGINIVALATAEAGEYGAVRLLVDDFDGARGVFRDNGVAHTSIEVLACELPIRPGMLARIARALSDNRVNIEYFYASSCTGADSAIGVFKVSDAKAADALLADAAD